MKKIIPLVSQIFHMDKNKITKVAQRFQTGDCGIPPFPAKPIIPPPPPPTFPGHLIRPPCLPDQEAARYPPDCNSLVGYYCPPKRQMYLNPPFSENIDFIPSGQSDCWWAKPKFCDWTVLEKEDELPLRV
uniref:Uncharacterized protein n=1 Tax=Graphocephala atropunctata TaxID=36148 RepID=A0A1B6M7Z6_9HEMI